MVPEIFLSQEQWDIYFEVLGLVGLVGMHKFLWLIVHLANTISHALMQASVQTFASASMREDSFKAPLGNELRDPTIDHRLHGNGPTHHLLPFF